MGKIRVKTIGNEEEETKDKAEKDRKRAEKKARGQAVEANSDYAQSSVPLRQSSSEASEPKEEAENQPPTPRVEVQTSSEEVSEQSSDEEKKLSEAKSAFGKKTKKEKFLKKAQKRSSSYSAKIMEIDKNKIYLLPEALELLRKVKIAKFDETVELHINTTEAGISGQVKLPHGTGKEIRVAVANDDVLAEVEKGKINFDVLIATPAMMPKLGKVARFLGPRGLMPNPKNGTISENPETAAKKFQGGQISFKTEAKNPILHAVVGKTSFKDTELSENIKTFISAVKKDRIRNITLKSTMSPGIKLQA